MEIPIDDLSRGKTSQMPTPNDVPLVEQASQALLEILESLDKEKIIPRKKLMNRLINVGLKEFLEVVKREDGTRTLALQDLGFPFKFVEQLDEAILALAHYFIRFRDEGGSLKVYAVNRLSKGEDKNLSYWQSEKARLYIELQNLILLLDGLPHSWQPELKRRSEIFRILTFRNIDDIAFLTQPAINVISEQLAAKVRVGFLFLKEFKDISSIDRLSNTLIIDFHPDKATSHQFNFYALYRLLSETDTPALPYQDRCKTRWYTSRDEAVSCDPRLAEVLRLFDVKEWKPLDEDNKHGVCEFERTGNEFFNKATLTMYKAFQGSSMRRTYGGAGDGDEAFISRLNETVITNDLIRLERAMRGFANSKKISAVDATSVKDSLKIHESTPIYRHWLRNSLNRILQSDDNELERIYILRDTSQDANVEFQAFKRQMQYYFDYLHYDISEVTKIVKAHDPEENSKTPHALSERAWIEKKWNSLRSRFRIYVTTTSVLEHFARHILKSEALPRMLGAILSETIPDIGDAHVLLSKLDYLATETMIYNFKNELADPSELKFEAYLYRAKKGFDIPMERSILFDFANQAGLSPLKRIQRRHRMIELVNSTVEYRDRYLDILKPRPEEHTSIDRVQTRLAQNEVMSATDVTTILEVRQAFEDRLYEHFRPRFEYLSDILKRQSLRIDFFEAPKEKMIETVAPFTACSNVESLARLIMHKVQVDPNNLSAPDFEDNAKPKQQRIIPSLTGE